MKYYRILDELHKPEGRWFLKSLNVVDEKKISVWKFLKPEAVEVPETEKLKISIREVGKPLDITFADFEVLVVNDKAALHFYNKGCQLIPVEVTGLKNEYSYFIAVILNNVDCLDENRSEFVKFQPDDPIRPDLAGRYKAIYKLFIDPKKIDQKIIFRLDKTANIIIINEELKKQLEDDGITGVKFVEVT